MGRASIVHNPFASQELGTCPRARNFDDAGSGCWIVDLCCNVDQWSMEIGGRDDFWTVALPVVDAGTREAHRFRSGNPCESNFGRIAPSAAGSDAFMDCDWAIADDLRAGCVVCYL